MIGIILLAGGKGERFGSKTPKQFLKLASKPLALHSFTTLLHIAPLSEIVVVCEDEYRHLFIGEKREGSPLIKFAPPGPLRQDSVSNGFDMLGTQCTLVSIHDSARPLVLLTEIQSVIAAAQKFGASALGKPIAPTIKSVDCEGRVIKTLDRSLLWEIQTPQVFRYEWLKAGLLHAKKEKIVVTDDLALIEKIEKPCMIVRGGDQNIKITTHQDLICAEALLMLRQEEQVLFI